MAMERELTEVAKAALLSTSHQQACWRATVDRIARRVQHHVHRQGSRAASKPARPLAVKGKDCRFSTPNAPKLRVKGKATATHLHRLNAMAEWKSVVNIAA
jgi:hypothetical protein